MSEVRAGARRRRLVPLRYEQLDDQQTQMWDHLRGGPRAGKVLRPEGHLTGPFDALLRSPVVGGVLDRLGAALRFDSSLTRRQLELVVVTTAAFWRAKFAWGSHAGYARDAGIPEEVLRALGEGRAPEFTLEEDKILSAVVGELLSTGRISDMAFHEALALLGERALVELVVLTGYYSLESFVLNAFRVELIAGMSSPWEEEQT